MSEPRSSLPDAFKRSDADVTQEEIMEAGGYVVGRPGMRRSATLRRDGEAPEHRTKIERRQGRGALE